MSKRGKQYTKASQSREKSEYTLDEAVGLVKKLVYAKFDESVDISACQIADFRCRFRGDTSHANEDAFVDLVQINAVPPAHFVKWMTYTESALQDNEWTVEGIYLDAGTSEPEVFDPGIFNPDEEIVLRMQINPAIEPGAANLVTVVTENGVSATAIFVGT